MPDRLHDSLEEERILPRGHAHTDHVARYEYVASRLGSSLKVLDAGCGSGYGSAILARWPSVGIDGSLTALSYARESYGSYLLPVAGDLLELPFPAETFDVVTCMEVIEHVPSPGALVAELSRVLKRGGTAFVSTPSARMELLYERSQGRNRWSHHISPLTPGQLRRAMRVNFGQVRLLGQTRDYGRTHMFLKCIDVFGLRFRRGVAQRTSAISASKPNEARVNFRFSRWATYGATALLAEARK